MFTPKYQIIPEILNNLTKIAEIKALVERAKLLPSKEVFLRRAAVAKMAHTSTSIEGNTLEEYQVKAMIEGKPIRAQKQDIVEVKNYLRALKIVGELSNNNKITFKDILKLHKTVIDGLVDKEKTGVFRSTPVFVVNILVNGKEQVVYTPPPAKRVVFEVENLLSWLFENSEIHPIIKAGIFHHQFESIHPFTDGNGRVGRLLTVLFLYLSEWGFRQSLVLEDYYNLKRKKYYENLQTGKTFNQRGGVDLTNWLLYFTDGFVYEAERLKDQVMLLENVKGNVSLETKFTAHDLKILDFVVTLGKITSDDVVDILKVPKRTAQMRLQKLEKEKVLEKSGSGPKTFYVLTKQ